MKKNRRGNCRGPKLEDDTTKMLDDYFLAFANFYGRIRLRDALEIINEQNNKQISEEQLVRFAKKKRHEDHYRIVNPADFYDDVEKCEALDWEIVESSLLDMDDEEYYDLVMAQKEKPICVLSKEDLLEYVDDWYFEETSEVRALEKYLEENARIIQPEDSRCANTARDAVEEYVFGLRIETDLGSSNIDALFRLVEFPENEGEFLEAITPLMQEVHNSTRMWANRGYTPYEMEELLGEVGAKKPDKI